MVRSGLIISFECAILVLIIKLCVAAHGLQFREYHDDLLIISTLMKVFLHIPDNRLTDPPIVLVAIS